MASSRQSTKRVQITKSQGIIVATTAIAAFLLVFTAIASKSLIGQIMYQNRVISAKKTAVNQLKTNIQTSDSLVSSYKAFVSTSQNVLGGNPQGTGQRDGDNAKIILDALPSKYDFPALTTSLEKIISAQNLQIQSISGNDDEVLQGASSSSPNPSPVPMPFQVAVSGDYQSIKNLVNTFGASIRPFQIQTMQIAGGQANMTLTITAQTYYQPAKNFDMTKKVVK